jgi:hypothetical protein
MTAGGKGTAKMIRPFPHAQGHKSRSRDYALRIREYGSDNRLSQQAERIRIEATSSNGTSFPVGGWV